MGYLVGIDTGGTFTDGMLFEVETQKKVRVKVLTTPYDLTECFHEALDSMARKVGLEIEEFLARCDDIRYSQTIATNTLITRSGTKLGLIVTRGNEGEVFSGRPETAIFNLVDKGLVAGVDEAVEATGRVTKKLEYSDGLSAIESLIERGARALVVCLKNSFANGANEVAMRDILRNEYPPQYLGRVPLFLSHEVAKVRDDHVRASSAVVAAYVHAKIATYLYRAEDTIRQRNYAKPLMLVNSDGSISRVAWTKSISLIGSGPAAGVIGAHEIARQVYGLDSVVTVDIGGTSLDLGMANGGTPRVRYYSDVDGLTVFQPTVDVESVALGGGSIAKAIDGEVALGPESVGSTPGPACFDRGGTEATPTDADLLLGYINPRNFLGGKLQLNASRAEQAVGDLGRELGLRAVETSLAIRSKLEERLVDAARHFLDRRRVNSPITAFVYGGGGPMHACALLREVEQVDRVYITPFSSEFSAMGCCMLDIGHHYYSEIDPYNSRRNSENAEEMIERARRDAEAEGRQSDKTAFSMFVHGDGDAKQVDNIEAIEEVLNASVWKGTVVLSLTSSSSSTKPKFAKAARTAAGPAPAMTGVRNVRLPRGNREVAIYSMEKLEPGNAIGGPAVIESEDMSMVVEPKFLAVLDEYGNLMLQRPS